MTSKKWLSWLGRDRSSSHIPDYAVGDDRLVELLMQRGASEEALDKAYRDRFLMHTRLASTLVEEGALDEAAALDALCSCKGLPGICLRRSTIDLSRQLLPEPMAAERLLLPVKEQPDGSMVLACADPLDEPELRDLELLLGRPVRPHLALKFYLRRTIRAVYQLRADCDDAVSLLGDDLDAEGIGDPDDQLVAVRPRVELPAWRRAADVEDLPPKRALVGMVDGEQRRRIGETLSGLGFAVLYADDGSTTLRNIVDHGPRVILLDARLPGRSGIEIIRRLGTAQRYSSLTQLLLLPDALDVPAGHLDGIATITLGAAEAVAVSIEDRLGQIANQEAAPRLEENKAARAHLRRAQAFCEDGDTDAAGGELNEALRLDPLLGEAHLEIARIAYSRRTEHRQEDRAVDAFSMAFDLGSAGPEDVACLAELLQEAGSLRQAAVWWQRAAMIWHDVDEAAALKAHAESLSFAESSAAD